MHFAVNVVAPYRLAHKVLPLLKKGDKPRVVNVTGGDKPIAVDVDNLQAEKGFKGLVTYTHSKAIMEAMTMVLARELTDVTVSVIFPGRASTSMTQGISLSSLPGPMKLLYPILKLMFRKDSGESAAKAAKSSIWAASASTELEAGKYYDTNCVEKPLHPVTADPEVQNKIIAVVKASLPK